VVTAQPRAASRTASNGRRWAARVAKLFIGRAGFQQM
jgi:hypothetical protein